MKTDKYRALTVSQLKEFCEEQVAKGNGNKKILISGDDEGNSYHGLFYQFMDSKEEIDSVSDLFDDYIEDRENLVILG